MRMTKVFVIPSVVEESLDSIIERCLDFARHDIRQWDLSFEHSGFLRH
jgi:hypothetical protein